MKPSLWIFLRVVPVFFILSVSEAGLSDTLKGSLGRLPVLAESKEKGILVDYLKAMQKVYPEGSLKFEVTPLERSIKDVVSGDSDFHAPLLMDPAKSEKEIGLTYSDATIFDVIFVLYTNKNKNVDKDHLENLNIETDVGASRFFDPKFKASTCIDCSLKKVDMGRIDGYIFAGLECDQLIANLKLKNVKSAAYRSFKVKFALPAGERGKKVNGILTQIVDKTKANGDFEKILGPINNYYKNWKPLN